MIYSANEWDPLKTVVLGTATNAHWPVECPIFRNQETITLWKETPLPSGPVSDIVVDEANEDLDRFADVLGSLGVTVVRPIDLSFKDFDGMYNYCPRDRVLIIGNTVIDAPMLYPSRRHELTALTHLFPDLISCDDADAMFDAANICRLNNDILYLLSESGNLKGAQWLQNTLGTEYKVHILDRSYKGVHIDSTISPVKEGLVVLNSDRINADNIPYIFKDWDKIWISGDQIVPQTFVEYPYASKYIALNFLTVNPGLIICDPAQTYLRSELSRYNVETIGVNLRHSRTLGGGHHCVTLDIERNG